MKEIHDALKQHYELVNAAFSFYTTGGSTSCFHMGLNNFTSFLEDCKVLLSMSSLSHIIHRTDLGGSFPWSTGHSHVHSTGTML